MLERMVRQQVDISRELHQRDYYNDPAQLDRMRLEHQTIANAITGRDITAAKQLVSQHLGHTSHVLLHLSHSEEA
jgi:GntR family transcriptional repressor for pyruvate dehydrogenase complex/GntR family L-lactate dehydrogenase operon transcriptional regulator